MDDRSETPPPSLAFVFLTFLRVGSVAFGGFMSLVSVVESVIVDRRRLLDHNDMLDGISLANLMPGPLAVNVVAYVGYRLRGGGGALAAVTGVLLPSFLLVLLLTDLYFRYGELEALTAVFAGFTPAVAAVIAAVVWRMAQKTLVNHIARLLAAGSLGALLLVPAEHKLAATFCIMFACGLIGLIWCDRPPAGAARPQPKPLPKVRMTLSVLAIGTLATLSVVPLDLEPDGLTRIGLTFSGLSVMLFGGGYVMIPMIQEVVVDQYGWLEPQQFIDGIALGQVTPGPILISATFIGHAVAGFAGALVATIAIFFPPALLLVTASHGLDAIKHSPRIAAAMRGIRCAVIAMILTATWSVFSSAVPQGLADPAQFGFAAFVFAASLLAQLRYRIDVIWVIPVAGLAGYLWSLAA